MACIEKQEQQQHQMNFLELRAKFGTTNGSTSSSSIIGERKNEEEEHVGKKSVAEKKKMFDLQHKLPSFSDNLLPPPLKPRREAPPPPPPQRCLSLNNNEEGKNSSLFVASSSSAAQISTENNERMESVKDVIQRFDKIGPRLFGPDMPSTSSSNWFASHKMMTLGRLKEKDEGEDDAQHEENILAKEVDSNSDESDLEGYSELSDATTETGGLIERLSRRGSSIGKGDTLTSGIIEEMRKKGLLKKIEPRLPLEVGRMRNAPRKPPRKGCASDPPRSMALEGILGMSKSHTEPNQIQQSNENDLPISLRMKTNFPSKGRRRTTGGGDETTQAKTMSMASSQSGGSIIMDEEMGSMELPTIPRYETGDDKENKRLRELHFVALEFFQVRRAYVDLLQHIGENYLNYLLECEKQMNRKLFIHVSPNNSHVIKRIGGQFQMILNVHKVFLEDFSIKVAKWDSRKPDMAEVFQQKADYLKICNNFLKEKRKLAAEFQQALDENRGQGNLNKES